MNQTTMKTRSGKIEVSRSEYQRLKELDRKFGYFLRFAEHVENIREARDELKRGMGRRQEKLFKELRV